MRSLIAVRGFVNRGMKVGVDDDGGRKPFRASKAGVEARCRLCSTGKQRRVAAPLGPSGWITRVDGAVSGTDGKFGAMVQECGGTKTG